ncbi:MAG: hypothetical protein GVX96_01880 [Bacteroidetes bacterium]|jgi:glucose uptake protein GlcU|nr:hypothetical protein [Bacteroidota bacterium]
MLWAAIDVFANFTRNIPMNKKILPALGIIIVAIILIVINEVTHTTIIKDYALIFIIAGMFLGMGLTKYFTKKS